ncbi:MAG: Fic family protein [Bacteroidetes bacterium]|nr:Fic family protein [Bacteroidota bacterium]
MKKSEKLADSILKYLNIKQLVSSKEISNQFQDEVSYATVKRKLQQLVSDGMVEIVGNGKSSKYKISEAFELIHSVDVDLYFQNEIDDRKIKNHFNHSLIQHSLKNAMLFSNDEKNKLFQLQNDYTNKISKLSEQEYRKEIERLAIDLSWKSSQIEGNTYSLLETEQLLMDKVTASGKTKDEAVMLLNHKAALDFIVSQPDYIEPLTVSIIENIHSILVQELHVDRNIRKRLVGISGTNYKPLDNEVQIREALQDMCELVNQKQDVFSKTLLVLVLISYIQPFADGNKRTARIISNAILMHHNHCPISFRTVDPIDYKKAMLIFYEQNNLSAFKKIFIEQFEFAVKTYF